MVGSNHGGGYVYSLCPANEPLTQACFQKLALPFVGDFTKIRRLDNRREPETHRTGAPAAPVPADHLSSAPVLRPPWTTSSSSAYRPS